MGQDEPGAFTKYDFNINLRRGIVTCPAGKQAVILKSGETKFEESDCSRCKLKPQCTEAPKRSIRIHPIEDLLIKLRKSNKTEQGREQLRRRVVVDMRVSAQRDHADRSIVISESGSS